MHCPALRPALRSALRPALRKFRVWSLGLGFRVGRLLSAKP